jgi:hypothetical protein
MQVPLNSPPPPLGLKTARLRPFVRAHLPPSHRVTGAAFGARHLPVDLWCAASRLSAGCLVTTPSVSPFVKNPIFRPKYFS